MVWLEQWRDEIKFRKKEVAARKHIMTIDGEHKSLNQDGGSSSLQSAEFRFVRSGNGTANEQIVRKKTVDKRTKYKYG